MDKLFGALLYIGAFLVVAVLIASEAFMPMWELAIWVVAIAVLVLVLEGSGKRKGK